MSATVVLGVIMSALVAAWGVQYLYPNAVERLVRWALNVKTIILGFLWLFILIGLASSNTIGGIGLALIGFFVGGLILFVLEPHKDVL